MAGPAPFYLLVSRAGGLDWIADDRWAFVVVVLYDTYPLSSFFSFAEYLSAVFRRSNLRLLTELHAAAVFDGSRLIVRIARSLCGLGLEGKDAR